MPFRLLHTLCVQSFRLGTMALMVLVGMLLLGVSGSFYYWLLFALRTVSVNASLPESIESRKHGDWNASASSFPGFRESVDVCVTNFLILQGLSKFPQDTSS